jgi:hypothetical protein
LATIEPALRYPDAGVPADSLDEGEGPSVRLQSFLEEWMRCE